MPGTIIVLELMLVGFMGWLKSTATSRVVPIAVTGGTSITTAGASPAGAGEWAALPQLMRKAPTRNALEILESCWIDMGLLRQYLGKLGASAPGG
jgi:hypothetical protein